MIPRCTYHTFHCLWHRSLFILDRLLYTTPGCWVLSLTRHAMADAILCAAMSIHIAAVVHVWLIDLFQSSPVLFLGLVSVLSDWLLSVREPSEGVRLHEEAVTPRADTRSLSRRC